MLAIFAFSLLGAAILSLVMCQARRKKQRKKRQHKLLKQIEFEFDNLRKLGDQIDVDMAITVKEDFELRRWWENYLSHPHEQVFRNIAPLVLFAILLAGCAGGGTPQFYYSANAPAYTCNSIPWPFRCQMEAWYQQWPRPAPKRGKRYFDPKPGYLSHSEFANQGVEKPAEKTKEASLGLIY